MHPILTIPLLVLLIGAAGIGVWKFGPTYLKQLTAERPLEAEDSRFAGLEPFVIPMIQRGGARRHVTLVIRLELAGPPAEARLEDLRPRFRHALFSELYALLGRRFVAERPDMPTLLKARLESVAGHVLGDKKVRAVWIESVSRRELAIDWAGVSHSV